MSRVILADDHPVFRDALQAVLEAQVPGVEVVAVASTGAECIRAVREKRPDLLILDLRMPDLGGFEVLEALNAEELTPKVIVVSQESDRAFVLRALRLGARGYVPKRSSASEVVAAVRAVLDGRTHIDPLVADLLIQAAIHPDAEAADEGELGLLTPREREVLRLVAEGRTARQIARTLSISPHTVNRHRSNLMEKLGVHGTADLVRLAVRNGLVEV